MYDILLALLLKIKIQKRVYLNYQSYWFVFPTNKNTFLCFIFVYISIIDKFVTSRVLKRMLHDLSMTIRSEAELCGRRWWGPLGNRRPTSEKDIGKWCEFRVSNFYIYHFRMIIYEMWSMLIVTICDSYMNSFNISFSHHSDRILFFCLCVSVRSSKKTYRTFRVLIRVRYSHRRHRFIDYLV